MPEYKDNLCVIVNDKKVLIPRFALVNGNLQTRYYSIRRNDVIDFLDYCTVEQLAEFMDVMLGDMYLYVNNMRADRNTKVYENFSVVWSNVEQQMSDIEKDQAAQMKEEEEVTEEVYEESLEEQGQEEDSWNEDDYLSDVEETYEEFSTYEEETYEESVAEVNNEPVAEEAKPAEETKPAEEINSAEEAKNAEEVKPAEEEKPAEEPKPEPKIPITMTVIVNNQPIVLKGKSSYVYVDVFEYIDFDLTRPQGTIVTTLNGRAAQYMENLSNGDRIEIYWRK